MRITGWGPPGKGPPFRNTRQDSEVTDTGSLGLQEVADLIAASGVSPVTLKQHLGARYVGRGRVRSVSGAWVPTVIGTVAVVEATDVLSVAGDNIVTAAIAATETVDLAALAGANIISGAVAATEAPDVVAASGDNIVTGTIAVTEAADAEAFTGDDIITGALAIVEAADIAAVTGSAQTTQQPVTGGFEDYWNQRYRVSRRPYKRNEPEIPEELQYVPQEPRRVRIQPRIAVRPIPAAITLALAPVESVPVPSISESVQPHSKFIEEMRVWQAQEELRARQEQDDEEAIIALLQ